eukprot:2111059-Pleurochrysis_carterae.AAC.3
MTLPSACSASHGTASQAPSGCDILLRSLTPLCTLFKTSRHICTTTCLALILEHHQLIRILAPLWLELAARSVFQQKMSAYSKRAYNLRSKKLFGLVRWHAVTDPAILQETDTTASGNGKSTWAILQSHVKPPRTGLANIDDDSECSSRMRHSDVSSDKRTITKIVAKINQINLGR